MKLRRDKHVELSFTRNEEIAIKRFINYLQNGGVLEEMGLDDVWLFLEYIVAESHPSPFVFTRWSGEDGLVTIHFEEEEN